MKSSQIFFFFPPQNHVGHLEIHIITNRQYNSTMEDTTAEMNYVNPNVKVPPLEIPKATEKTEEEHPATCMEKAFMFAGFYAGK